MIELLLIKYTPVQQVKCQYQMCGSGAEKFSLSVKKIQFENVKIAVECLLMLRAHHKLHIPAVHNIGMADKPAIQYFAV